MEIKKNWLIATKDIYLRTKFEDKDEIKDRGGMYDREKKRWFIPRGLTFVFREFWGIFGLPL